MGRSIEWYDEVILNEEDPLYGYPEEEDIITDKYGVRYTKDMKRLIGCLASFNRIEYQVPDGVEVICEHAFATCSFYLRLVIPRSVRIIGSNIFGIEWGRIEVRD